MEENNPVLVIGKDEPEAPLPEDPAVEKITLSQSQLNTIFNKAVQQTKKKIAASKARKSARSARRASRRSRNGMHL